MKYKFYYLIFFVCVNCDFSPKKDKIIITEEEEIIVGLSEKKSQVLKETESVVEDCIFDQETQTDDFLKNIIEFEGYVWDSKTKTAEIILDDHWDLVITRGGCDHFSILADFTLKNSSRLCLGVKWKV